MTGKRIFKFALRILVVVLIVVLIFVFVAAILIIHKIIPPVFAFDF